jgi:hypothetical protein
MFIKNFWLRNPDPISSAPAAPSTGFSSRVEDYGESEGGDSASAAYDPEEEEDFDTENQEISGSEAGGSLPKQSPTDASKQVTPFSAYEFKGKVNGEEIAQKFESKKDLDLAIARGIQAPKIYEALQAAKKDISKLKGDAEWAQDLQALAKDSPEEFFENVVEELMDERQLAIWVHKKYTEYKRLSDLPEAELARERQLQAANKLMKEQAYHEKSRQASEAAAAKARSEQETVALHSWASKEKQIWEAKLPEHLRGSIDDYMRTVAIVAKSHLDKGEEYGLKEMSNHLKKLLLPLTNITQSPSQTKREEANRGVANAQANTEALRKLATEQAQQQRNAPRKSRSDMWKDVKRKVLSEM